MFEGIIEWLGCREGCHYLCALHSTSATDTWLPQALVRHLSDVLHHVLWWVSSFITLVVTLRASSFYLFFAMSALLCVFIFGFGVWVKHSTDDGVGGLHYVCCLSTIVGLLSLLNCFHVLVNGIGFPLFLLYSACQCCSFYTSKGLHITWWLFGKEPVEISSQFKVKGKFTGLLWFLFDIVFNIYAIAYFFYFFMFSKLFATLVSFEECLASSREGFNIQHAWAWLLRIFGKKNPTSHCHCVFQHLPSCWNFCYFLSWSFSGLEFQGFSLYFCYCCSWRSVSMLKLQVYLLKLTLALRNCR